MLPATEAARSAHQRADRLGDASLPPDHLAKIILTDTQANDRRIAVVANLTHGNRIWVVNQIARDELDKPTHCSW
jgi:hypothetical protein